MEKELNERIIKDQDYWNYKDRANFIDSSSNISLDPIQIEKVRERLIEASNELKSFKRFLVESGRIGRKDWSISVQLIPKFSIDSFGKYLYSSYNPVFNPVSLEVDKENPNVMIPEDIAKEIEIFKVASCLSWRDINEIEDFDIDLIYTEEK